MKDELYKDPLVQPEKFEFSDKVAAVFNDMIRRSVPYYEANQIMTAQMAAEFYIDKSNIYDLGCSTGKTAQCIGQAFASRHFFYKGIDNSPSMIDRANLALEKLPDNQAVEFIAANIEDFPFENASVFISNYTLQFIAPEKRLSLLKRIYSALSTKGVFLLSEKVIETESVFSKIFAEMHHNMKKAHGYSDTEIIQKRDALEDVLIPNTTEQNISLLKEAGFQKIAIYHKWYNFASYIALK